MSFPPSKQTGYGVWFASLQRQSLNMGGEKKTMVVGGVWQRQTPHDPWVVGVGRKLPNANMGA